MSIRCTSPERSGGSGATEGGGAFSGREFTPLSGGEGERREREVADGGAHEPESRVADGGGDAAHLTVFALGQGEREPRGGDVDAVANRWVSWRQGRFGAEEFGCAGKGAEFAEIDAAAAQAGQGGGVGHALDLGPIRAGVGVLRVEQPRVEAGLIGKEQEPFRVGVEAAQRIDAGR